MSAISKKKQISQEELRKLMKQRAQSNRNKIESQFAKYNSLDQLSCSLCCLNIKSELMWNAHILSRTHKENLLKSQTCSVSKPIIKRANDDPETTVSKKKSKATEEIATNKKSNILTSLDVNEVVNIKTPSNVGPKSILKNKTEVIRTNTANVSWNKESDDDEEESNSNIPVNAKVAEVNTEITPEVAQFIPEGFFDDPKLDAKVRNIPYKDKMEEQMELFQKAIKEEAIVSETIIEEDDDQRDEQRLLDEIDEQMMLWSKIETLAKSKKPISKIDIKKEESDVDEDDNSVSDFLDWRNKSALNKYN